MEVEMVNNNEEKLNKGEGQVDDKDITLSGEELEEMCIRDRHLRCYWIIR